MVRANPALNMRDLESYALEDIQKLEKLIQIEDLLRVIDYRVETVQRGSEKWKCFCPIHQEKVFRSLVIDVVKRTFRCSFTQCKGYRGGSLLDFYRLATGKSESETVKFWSERLKCPISPKAEEASAKAEEKEEAVPLVEPKRVQLAEYDDAKVKDLFERDAALERLEEAEGQDASAEADLGIQIVEPEPAEPVEEPADVLIEEPASSTVSPLPLQTADQFVLEVKQRLAQGALDAAEQLLDEALRRHRDHPELLHTRALLLQKKGEPDSAVHTLRHLIELYGRMHVPEGSLRAARQLLEIKPHDLQAYNAMVEAHLERHESDQAVRFLREAAAHCMRSERLEEALERLERVLEIVPGDTRAAEDRIKVLCALNRTAQAVAAQIDLAKLYVGKELAGKATAILEKAVEIDPQSREAHAALAELYLARGMQEQAVGQMQRLSELLLAADEMDEAIRLYQRVLKLEPKQTEVRNRLALLYRHTGEREAALEEYFQIARIYRDREMLGRAVRVYKNILKWVPDHLQARRMLMETLLDKDDASGAVEEALRLADALCAAGQESEAEEALLQALKWGAAAETVHRRLIGLYTRARRMDQALEHYEQLLQLLEERQDEEAVRRCCEEMLRLEPAHAGAKARLEALERPRPVAGIPSAGPGSVGTMIERGRALLAEGRFEEAVEALRSALVVEPHRVELWQDLAEAYLRNGKEDEAVKTLLRFSRHQVQQKREEQALQLVRSARQRLPERLELLREQAELETALGDSGKALLTYQEVLKRDPEDPKDWLALAALAEQGGHPERALEAFSEAAERFGQEGHLESAGRALRRALTLRPEEPELHLRLARLLADSGEPAEAVAEQLKAVNLLKSAGEGPRALEIVEEILRRQPEHLPALEQWFDLVQGEEERVRAQLGQALELATRYQQQGLPGKAIEHVERLRERFGDDERVWRKQIALYRDTGAVQKAAACLLDLGHRHRAQGQPDEALRCFLEAEEIVPDWSECLHAQLEWYRSSADIEGQHRLLIRLADLSAERGLVGKQIAYLTEAWQLGEGAGKPAETLCAERLVDVYLAKGDESEAVQVLSRLAEQYRRAGAPEQVQKTYERILSIQPGHSQVRFQLAHHQLERGDEDTARGQLEQIARQYPAEQLPPSEPEQIEVIERTLQLLFEMTGQVGFGQHLGHLYRSVEDYPAAQCAYLEALERCPEAQVERAIEIGRDLLQVAPGESAVERRLVDLYPKAGRPLEAVPLLRSLWKRYLHNWEVAGGEGPVLSGPVVERVEEIASQLLELQGEDEVVHQRMADFYLALGRTDEAVSHWVTLGEVFTERGEKGFAAEVYRRILEVRPELLEVHVRLAEVLESQGQVTQAAQEYLELGRTAAAQKQWDQARAAFQRAAELEPDPREALGAMLDIARRRKDTEEIKGLLLRLADLEPEEPRHLEAYLALEPEDITVGRRYVLLLQAAGRFEALEAPLETLLSKYRKAKQFEMALEVLDRIKEHFPRYPQPYQQAIAVLEDQERQAKREGLPSTLAEGLRRRLSAERLAYGELLEEAGEQEALAEQLSKVVRSDEEDDRSRRRLAELYLAAGEKSKAATLWQQIGDIASRRGQLAEAQEAYAQAKDLSPRSRNIRKRLATLSAERGSIEEAVAEQRQLAEQAREEGDWETAVQALEELLRYMPEDEDSLRLLAERYAEEERPEQACEKAEILLRLVERRQDDEAILHWSNFILQWQPDNSAVLQKQGAALLALGRLEEAAECLWKQAESFRRQGRSSAEQGACLKLLELAQERTDLSRQACERLFELGMARRARTELERLAEHSLEQDRLEDALSLYRSLCERYAEEPKYRLALADCLARSGQDSEALEQRLELHELYRRGEHPVEMVANLKDALKLAPGQAQWHQLLGDVLAELGNYREGVQSLLEAAGLAEQEPDQARAVQCYRSVLAIDSSHLEAHRRFHRLQSGATLSDEEREELLAVRQRLLSLLAEQGPGAASEMDRLGQQLLEDSPEDERVVALLAEAYRSARPEQAAALYLNLMGQALRREDWATAQSVLKRLRQLVQELEPFPFKALEKLVALCEETSLAAQILPERARLAAYYTERQDHEAAIGHYEWLVQSDPERLEYRQALIENLDVAGHHTRSREEKLRLAALHRAQGRLSDAAGWLESALSYEKDNPECLEQLADILCEMGAPQRARPILSQLAELAEDSGSLSQAESYCRRLVQLFPGDGSLLERLAKLHQIRGDSEQAGEMLLQAAQAYAEGEQVSRAIALYERVAGQQPERIEVRRRLADLLRDKGLLEQALAQERAIIQWHVKRGRSEEALACYQRLLEQEPRNLGLQQELGELYLELGREAEGTDVLYQLALKYQYRELIRRAQETLQRILSIRPEHREARERLAAIYIEKGMETEGQQELLVLAGQIHSGQVPSDCPPRELVSLGRRILELGPAHQEALEALAGLLESPLAEERLTTEGAEASGMAGAGALQAELLVEVRIALARLFLNRGVSEAAADSLEKVEALAPEHPELRVLQDQLRRLRQFQIPREQYEQTARRAYEHWEHGEYGAAAQLLERLRQAHSQDLDVLLRLAEAYLRQDLLPRALELLENGGRQFLSERNLEAARQCFHRLLELAPEHFSAHLALAQLAQAEGDSGAALEQYLRLSGMVQDPAQLPALAAALEQARHIDAQNEPLLRRLATVYEKLERLEDARETYRTLAESCRRQGQIEEAVKAFEQALALGPPLDAATAAQAPRETVSHSIALHLDLAETLMQGGQASRAGGQWLTAGELARAIGEFDQAQSSFRRVLELSSKEQKGAAPLDDSLVVRAYEGLAETFAQWGKPEQAAEALLSLAGEPPGPRNQLSRCIALLERAHALVPGQRQPLEQLSQAYLEAGREEDYIRSSLRLGQVLRQRDLIGRAESVYRSLCALPRWDAAGLSPEQGELSYQEVVGPLLDLCLDKGDEGEAARLLADLAERYLKAGRPEQARQQLERIVQLQPDHLESVERLAELYLSQDQSGPALDMLSRLSALHEKRGHFQQALETSLQMLELDPECEAALAAVERLSRALGQSRQVFQALLERFEQSFTARRVGAVLALGHSLLGLDARAEQVRIRLPETSVWQGRPEDAVDQWCRLAEQYSRKQEWSWAQQCLQRAVELAPGREDLQELLAGAQKALAHQAESRRWEAIQRKVEEHLSGAEPQRALEELESLIACSATTEGDTREQFIPLLEWGAELFEQAGQGKEPFVAPAKPEQRSAWLKRGLQLRLQLAETLRAEGKSEEAIRQAECVLSAGTWPSGVSKSQALCTEEQAAMTLLFDLLEESGRVENLVERGRALAQQCGARGQWESAVGVYRRLLERVPEETTLLGELAAALGKRNLPREAAEAYRRQAEVFLARELFAQALSAYKRVLTLCPDEPATLEALARVYVVRGDIRGAQTYYRKLLELHLQHHQEVAAEQVLDRMIELEPEQPQLRREKADLLLRGGRLAQARRELERLAERYLEQELLNKAIEVWSEMVNLAPDDRSSRMQLIEAYEQKGQPEEAAQQYLELAERWQDRDGPQGHPGFAGECLENALRLAPRSVEVLRRCAECQAQRGREKECVETLGRLAGLLETQGDLQEAARVYEQMLSIEPEATAALERLAQLYETLEQTERAAPMLERLAEQYERAGKSEEAVETYLRVAGYYCEVALSSR